MQTWGDDIIRSKGCVWGIQNPDMCYIFEQAGRQVTLTEQAYFVDSAPVEERERILAQNPQLLENWDPQVGDRETKLCFIGRHMDREALVAGLDACLVNWTRRR